MSTVSAAQTALTLSVTISGCFLWHLGIKMFCGQTVKHVWTVTCSGRCGCWDFFPTSTVWLPCRPCIIIIPKVPLDYHGLPDQLGEQISPQRPRYILPQNKLKYLFCLWASEAKLVNACLPWVSLVVGWHPAIAPPNSSRSGISHRAHRAESSGVYRSSPHDGCTATGVYSETWRGGAGSKSRTRATNKHTAGRRKRKGGCNRLQRRWDTAGFNSPSNSEHSSLTGDKKSKSETVNNVCSR